MSRLSPLLRWAQPVERAGPGGERSGAAGRGRPPPPYHHCIQTLHLALGLEPVAAPPSQVLRPAR